MAYKVRFRPVELLTAEGWRRYGPDDGPRAWHSTAEPRGGLSA